ncbi:MAG: lytic transglycosylase domain-containing protein [Terriglobales bacterium]
MTRSEPFATVRAAGIAVKAGALFCAVILVLLVALLARPATAAELAILRNGFSIRHEHRLAMGMTTRLYLAADDSSFTDVPTAEITGYEKDLLLPLPTPADAHASMAARSEIAKSESVRSGPALNEVVNSASAAYHLDPDLVNSVIHAESGFNARAVSPKGARGLMQLMPATASQLGVNDAFDPQTNVAGGSRYLRELLERYNFDLVKALAAYNAGPERVEQYQGVPPFRETRAYVARIVHEYNTRKIAQEKEAKQKQASAQTPRKAPVKVQNPAQNATQSPAHRAPTPAATAIAAASPR